MGRVPSAAMGGDAEALGGVVEPEPDDQDRRERDLARSGRLPDRQPLREVVDADADRDHQRQSGRRDGLEPGVHRHRPDESPLEIDETEHPDAKPADEEQEQPREGRPPLPSFAASREAWIGSVALVITSQRRKTRMPTAVAFNSACQERETFFSRATGKPRRS